MNLSAEEKIMYYLSKVFVLDKTEIVKVLTDTGRTLDNFNGFLYRTEELRHSYDKFRLAGDVQKPPFDEIYQSVKMYIKDFLPKERSRDER